MLLYFYSKTRFPFILLFYWTWVHFQRKLEKACIRLQYKVMARQFQPKKNGETALLQRVHWCTQHTSTRTPYLLWRYFALMWCCSCWFEKSVPFSSKHPQLCRSFFTEQACVLFSPSSQKTGFPQTKKIITCLCNSLVTFYQSSFPVRLCTILLKEEQLGGPDNCKKILKQSQLLFITAFSSHSFWICSSFFFKSFLYIFFLSFQLNLNEAVETLKPLPYF